MVNEIKDLFAKCRQSSGYWYLQAPDNNLMRLFKYGNDLKSLEHAQMLYTCKLQQLYTTVVSKC